MARLLLIRHGETMWNREKRYQGTADIPLSDKGRAQARRVAEVLADKQLGAVYSSPLSRALDTANLIAEKHGLQVVSRDKLKEIDVGEWSGKTWPEIERLWPQLAVAWRKDPYTSEPPPGGEKYVEFQARCIGALDKIAGAFGEDDQVAVVCHGGVIRAVMAELLKFPWETRGKIYSQNCSVTSMRWQPGGQVVIDGFNDSCHLIGEE